VRRRDFITLLGGAAAAWPLAARAQQTERVRHIGVLVSLPANDPEMQLWLAAFQKGLESLGWSEGRNVRIDHRFYTPGADQVQVPAKELVALQPDVILAEGTSTVAALKRETRAIPIVFVAVSDPIGSGFIASLARPGGNVTGVMQYEAGITGKWLAMLKEIAPGTSRAALLANPRATAYDYFLRAAETAASSLAIDVVPSPVENIADIEHAIESFARAPNGGLVLPRTPRQSRSGTPSSHSRTGTDCRRFTLSGHLSRLAVSCPTALIAGTCIGKQLRILTASCGAPILPIFQCRRLPSTKRPSTSKPQRRSA
jgi:putative tryptophan/tyrosine transport system substrate-binding protein